ncbi:MAG: hypothetical protein ABSF77_00980 [Spirochaetia bacterium]|jgi:hypothetical protein
MRKILCAAVLFAFVSAATVFAFDPDELNKITFQNTTGTKIEMIFLSPGDSDYWGPDIIGADYVLKDSSSIGYYVHYPEKSFKFDIMATDDQGNKFELRDLVLTDGKEGTVKLTRKSLNSAAPDFTLATIHLENDTGHELQYLFLSPNDSKAWGVDLLDEDTTLADGDTHSIVLPVGKQKVKYNLMAVDENNDEYQFDMSIDPNKGKEFTWSIDATDLQTGE